MAARRHLPYTTRLRIAGRQSVMSTPPDSPFFFAAAALEYIVLRHIPRTQPASGTISAGGSNTGYLIVQEDSHDSAAPPALSRFAHSSMFRRTFHYRLQEAHCSAASADSATACSGEVYGDTLRRSHLHQEGRICASLVDHHRRAECLDRS